MNKQEIDEMMKDLPSQQELPPETVWAKGIMGVLMFSFLLWVIWSPDLEPTCRHQTTLTLTGEFCK